VCKLVWLVDIFGDRALERQGLSGLSLELPGDNTKWTLMFANVTEKDICKL
jgi:hypothetical protein